MSNSREHVMVVEAVDHEAIVRETVAGEGVLKTPVSPDGRSAMTRYVVQVFGLLLVLYMLPLIIARSARYEDNNLSFYSRPLNYAFETWVKDADVVIFGDSTAMFGVDPSQMQPALDMTVVNLPNTHGSLMVDDDLPLRRYLAKNKPPKLIVFYFAPWDFNYGNVNLDSIHIFEGEELLARQGTVKEILAFVRKKPIEGLLFPLRFYADTLQFFSHRVSHEGQKDTLARRHGYVENVDVSVLADPCKFPPLLLDNIRFDWVKALAARHRTAETNVMFYVAPIPSCSNVSEVLHHDYGSLPAQPPVQLPASAFVHDVRYIHPHKEVTQELTRNLINAVRPYLQKPK